MSIDADLLHAVNRGLANPALDAVMILVSILGEIVPYSLLILWPWLKHRRWDALAFAVAMTVSEIAVFVLKLAIERPRPDDVRLVWPADGFSMPSGHAARAVAGAVALWRLGPRWRIGLGAFAAVVMFDRVYIGAHYPSDVAAGAIIGLLSGLAALSLVSALQYESALPTPQRAPALQRAWQRAKRFALFIFQIDYAYKLKLLGRLSQEQAKRLGRASTYWALLRFFVPLFMIAAGALALLVTFPPLAVKTFTCFAGYFVPFGLEWSVPACVLLGVPWWLSVAAIAYVDAWVALFLIFNFDFLYGIPRLGRMLEKAQDHSTRFVRRHRWIMNVQFIGVAFFVFIPINGTGMIPGVLAGRFIGMPKALVWAAVMTGTIVRISAFALATVGFIHVFQ